jgi:hypothetical protein
MLLHVLNRIDGELNMPFFSSRSSLVLRGLTWPTDYVQAIIAPSSGGNACPACARIFADGTKQRREQSAGLATKSTCADEADDFSN